MKRVREITGWSDPVEEKTGFVEAACQNYEALVEEKQVGKTGTSGPSQRTRPGSGHDGTKPAGPVRKTTPRRAGTD